MSAVQRVLLGRKHTMPAWILAGYLAIVKDGAQMIEDAEALAMGWETAARLMRIKINYIMGTYPVCKKCEEESVGPSSVTASIERCGGCEERYDTQEKVTKVDRCSYDLAGKIRAEFGMHFGGRVA